MKASDRRIPKPQPFVMNKHLRGKHIESVIPKYSAGQQKNDFTHILTLHPVARIQIRDAALEAARKSLTKDLAGTKTVKVGTGKQEVKKYDVDFFMEIGVYPHRILRENKILGFAKAERLQQGMSKSYGKPVDRGAAITPQNEIFRVFCYERGIPLVKAALLSAAKKLPLKYRVVLTEVKKVDRHSQ